MKRRVPDRAFDTVPHLVPVETEKHEIDCKNCNHPDCTTCFERRMMEAAWLIDG